MWTLVALGTVYFYVVFTVQFPEGYWDPFIPVPTPVNQPECVAKKSSVHPTGQLAEWGDDPFKDGWIASPAEEDYTTFMRDPDRRLLNELNLYSGTAGPKSSRISRFYNLETEEDWKYYISELDDTVI